MELREEIKWIGLKQDQLGDATHQSRCSLHGNRTAERVTDEINLLGIMRQRGFDETCLIVKRLSHFGRPWRSLAVSKQVHRTDTKLTLQIVHQPAPLARARYAGMYQHDHRADEPASR
jgi:hypothetical protein